MQNTSDEDLMAGIKDGNQEAVLELYNRHSAKVWLYLRKRVPASSVDDLFQDVFVKIVKKKDIWNGHPFLLWFYVVIRNIVMDFYRDKKIESKYFELLSSHPLTQETSLELDELLATVSKDNAKLLREFFQEGWSSPKIVDTFFGELQV